MGDRGRRSDAGPLPVFIQIVCSTILKGAGIITIEDREILKAVKRRSQIIDKLAAIRLTAVFPTIAMAARMQWNDIFSVSIGSN